MSESNDQAAGVLGAGATAASAAAMAKSGLPVSLIIGIVITVAIIGTVVFIKYRQSNQG